LDGVPATAPVQLWHHPPVRILLIEDDERLAERTAEYLETHKASVEIVHHGERGLERAGSGEHDIVLLDLMLPDDTGLNALKEMRHRGNVTPVLILTALGAVEDRVRGLDCGADDYLVKPFAMQELIARLRALLRRPGGALGRTLTLGSVKLDTSARIATVAETQLDLTRSELIVLEMLLRNQGRVISKERLAECLYNFEQERSANSVETQVHRLRKKLAAAGADMSLRTLRGLGYLAS
jgi:DNA-binding response OmpR family regulator